MADLTLHVGRAELKLRAEAWLHEVGSAATGLAVGGMTSCWRAAFHYLGSAEGDAPEVKHPMHGPRSMAA